MSRGDIIGGAAVPLTDALPWETSGPTSSRTFLVNDSIGADGRFLLYTLASQVVSSSKPVVGRVIWLACGPITESQVLQGLKKIGCDKTVISQAKLRTNSSSPNATTTSSDTQEPSLTVLSCAEEMSEKLKSNTEESTGAEFSEQAYLKQLYQDIQMWIQAKTSPDSSTTNQWIIVDDVSALASLLGERLVHSFLLALSSKSHQQKFGLMIRCSNDFEQESLPTLAGSSVAGPDWFGAGGLFKENPSPAAIPWERSLIEIADGVMDVLPLSSGYTRELHGKIVLTQIPQGRGWSDQEGASRKKRTSPMQTINYCITDNKIVAYVL